MKGRLRSAILIALICVPAIAIAKERVERDPAERVRPDWRRPALRAMRAAAGISMSRPSDLALYGAAGFNTLVLYDADAYNADATAWNYKSEDEIRAETLAARLNGFPIVVGLAVEPFLSIPQATDSEIIERIALWKQYGNDLIIGVSPWYDDVFWHNVTVERQRHVYALIKQAAPDWYVFGMIGDFGFSASDEDVARYFDPAAFDHVIVLMYPFSLGEVATGFALDNVASSDPDGDMRRYVDRFVARMTARFFSRMAVSQLIVLVVQAFSYPTDPVGRVPRPSDIRIMTERGNELLQQLSGQWLNNSAAYCCWGGPGAPYSGIVDHADWMQAAKETNDRVKNSAKR